MTTFRSEDVSRGLSYDDVLLVPQRSPVDSRNDVSLETRFVGDVELENPLVSAPMDTVTESNLATALAIEGGIGVVHRFLSPYEQAAEIRRVRNSGHQVAAAVGVDENYEERAEKVISAGADALVFDIAHGHLEKALKAVEKLSKYDVPLVAGNVATGAGARDLASVGADAVKVGIGPGAFCTTREVTGVGVPQLTAVAECASAVPSDVCVIADGGIRTSGDAAKALMAGADTVMMGTFFAKTKEAAGMQEEQNAARGMATKAANQSRTDKDVETPDADEGVEGVVECKGTVSERVNEFLAGIRSAVSYCGGHTITEARENAEFVEITPATQRRNGDHYDKA